MSRQRVSKGSVIPKKEFKIATVLSSLPVGCDFDSFFSEFKRIYPKDWERVNKRYQEHERLTKPGKSHPMAHPLSYMKTAFNSFKRKLLKESITDKDFLLSLEGPKEKYSESEPTEKVKKDIKRNINIVYSFEKRLLAVHLLGKYKCQECIDMLVNIMNSDHTFEVRKLAYDKLVRFGLDVGSQPKKPPHHTDPQITQKIASLGFSAEQVKDKKTCERAINEFRKKYPIEYDLYTHSKRNQFKAWFRKQIS
ncbi:hypothetical protein WCT78_00175 [Pectobacterium versatile]|uniref:hypothetical protein n=1 Tax=Pectobacterium TaxID=122277 RepID=UPI001660CE86|nr:MULTISPECIES: hypothetical protein [Pectobacterium]MBK4824871.1 hypothetical protein [Pectobacterium carotovorum subsp. carotovorum]MCQ8232888.1 hypothetical protein [Pectobacterium carotovorum]UNE78603.1 hypothetical protein IMY97_23335 [Pectobacterium versatile]